MPEPASPPLPFDVEAAQYVNLATYRRSGVAVLTPVWIAGHEGRYFVFSEGSAGKVKRIRNNGRARIARCTFGGRILSPWIDLRAQIVEDPATISMAYRALHAKYGIRMRIADALAKLTGRFERRAVLALALEPGSPG